MFGSSFLLDINMISSFSSGARDSRFEISFSASLYSLLKSAFIASSYSWLCLRAEIYKLIVYFFVYWVFYEKHFVID